MDIKLVAITPNSEGLISISYAKCTGKKEIPVENIQRWVKLGHTSPLEHACFTVDVCGISRACLAQITRHRIGCSYSVLSQRYVNMATQPQTVPNTIFESGLLAEYGKHMGDAQILYQKLVDAGVPKEDSRAVLPMSTTTELIMTMNFRAARHFIELRTSKQAQKEIRTLANKILDILIEQAPHVFSDLSIDRQQGKEMNG